MNLHGIVAPAIGVVNPLIPVSIRISVGQEATSPAGRRAPKYATPGSFIGSIAGDVLTVSAVATGVLQPGQTITGAGVPAGVLITAQLSGTAGGPGTYSLNKGELAVASEAMTTTCSLLAQVQPLSSTDLQKLDGLNLNGSKRKVYLSGSVDSVVRVSRRGGDLVTIAGGVNDGVWLVNQVLEQYPDWVSAAITLQDGS